MSLYVVTYAITHDPMERAEGLVRRRYEEATDATLAADQAAHFEAAKRGRSVDIIQVREAVQP